MTLEEEQEEDSGFLPPPSLPPSLPPSFASPLRERQNAATETEKIPGREISRVTLLNGSNDATLYGEDRQVLSVTSRIQWMTRGTCSLLNCQ